MSTFYVTTSIPYVNAEPHVGFGMELLYADVLARYHRILGDTTLFSTGTDEHGGKIKESAIAKGVEPLAYVDVISESFRGLGKLLNVSEDRFIRTTNPAHESAAQEIWRRLETYIYKGTYKGLYCTGCEEFVTEKLAKERNGVCPNHNKPYEQLEEENYFFKLSAFTAPVLKAIEEQSFQIVPERKKNEILAVLKEGLEDISVSRPITQLDWGVPVPGDPNQVMYVWFEALMNYLTVLGFPDSEDYSTFWPANVQIVGKDIIRFHAAIWPAMLIGLGIPLPKLLYVHGFVTSEGQKMSKSIGNVISPSEVVENYGVDAFRYYFLRHIPSYDDGDFSWRRFETVYNTELGNELGNLVQRVAVMIGRYLQGVIGETPGPNHDIAAYHDALRICRFDKALEVVWLQVRGLNQYLEEQKPWVIAKNPDEFDHLREVLAYAVSNLLEIASLLEPFLPDTATKIKELFSPGYIKDIPKALFPKIELHTGEQSTVNADAH